MKKLYPEQSVEKIAKAIRDYDKIQDKMTINQMADKINNFTGGLKLSFDPNILEYNKNRKYYKSNLDVLDITDFEGLYLLYDINTYPTTQGYNFIGVWIETIDNVDYTVEVGNIENNEFVASYSITAASKEPFRSNLTAFYQYSKHMPQIIFKITGPIKAFCFISEEEGKNNVLNQPCFERRGRLPNLEGKIGTYWQTSTTSAADFPVPAKWYVNTLEIDIIKDVSKITFMEYLYASAFALKQLDINTWDISNVTSLKGVFMYCRSLKYLDLNNWDTSNITTLYNTWDSCYSLKELNISNWDVSKVITLCQTWNHCVSLEKLNLSKWKTLSLGTEELSSDWEFSNPLNNTWQECHSLRHLDLNNFDTSHVKILNYTWAYCVSLQTLEISNWNVSNVTNLSTPWHYCCSLQKLDLSKWNPKLTTCYSMFNGCFSLEEFDVSNFDVSNLTEIPSFGIGLYSLKKLDLSKWDLKKVTKTSSSNPWNMTSNNLTEFYYPKITLTTVSSTYDNVGFLLFSPDSNYIYILDASSIDVSKLPQTQQQKVKTRIDKSWPTQTVYPPILSINQDYSAPQWSANEIQRIIYNLPYVSSSLNRTITISTYMYNRLSSQIKSRATSYGWTIVQA